MTQAIDCAYSIEGEGPPLFLIHGIGAARNTWRKAMPVLTPHFSVVTYDLRGHGESPMPKQPFGLDELVADLEAVRVKTGFEAAHFAGHSLGGMIGPAYARAFPGRVQSLGLLSTAAFRTEDDSAKVKGVVKAMRSQSVPEILATLANRWFTDAFIATSPEVVQARMDQVVGTDAEIFLNVFDIYAGTEMAPWLDDITAPSLVLTGENDGGCPPRLNELIAAAMPRAELVVLPEVKHSIMLECGDVVAQHMLSFIKGLTP
jgi:pimeloyl-ACP methyl ester carboxylesterase